MDTVCDKSRLCDTYYIPCTVAYTICRTMYSLHFASYTIRRTMYSVHCASYNVLSTLRFVHYTPYNELSKQPSSQHVVQCMAYTALRTLHVVQCTQYTEVVVLSTHCMTCSIRSVQCTVYALQTLASLWLSLNEFTMACGSWQTMKTTTTMISIVVTRCCSDAWNGNVGLGRSLEGRDWGLKVTWSASWSLGDV